MNDLTQPNVNRRGRKALALSALLLLALAPLRALEVGKISVAAEGGHETLKVETSGEASPRLEQPKGRVVLVIPGGKRAMKTVKVGGSHPVKQIRFGAEGGDLRVVLDLSKAVKASLGPIDAKGFSVLLDPVAKGGTAAKSSAPSVPAASGGASAAEASADAALDPAQAGYTYSIVDLALGGDDEHSELVVSANGPASYKPSVREKGKLIILSFRNSSLAFSGDLAKLKDNAIESVSAKQLSVGGEATVKVEVRLTQKLDYALQRDQNQLLLRLDRPQAEAHAPKMGDLETPVSVDVQNADLVGVIKTLAEQAGFEYQFTKTILSKTPPDSLVTAKVENRPFREVAETLLSQVDGKMLRQGNTLFIGDDTEITARRDRLPTITRAYTPKYLSYAQLIQVLGIQYYFDKKAQERIKGIVQDPRDKSRILLIGTKEEVSDWLAIIARYDAPEQGEAAAGDDSDAGSSAPKTQIFRLQYMDQSQFGLLDASIKQLYPAGEDPPVTYMDPGTRTLVVTTKVKFLRKIEKLLARLDVRPPQVNIEGRIVEVDQTVANQMGIDWSAASLAANPSTSADFSSNLPTAFLSQLTYGTVQNGYSINARIQAMVDHNQADLVSAPNVTVNDNTAAHIATTDNIVIVSTTQTVTQGVISTNTVNQQFPIPLTLDVLPKISGADRRVAMHIIFTLTTASGTSTLAGAPPPTSRQEATTDVNVTSGDTAVIGGLVRQNNLTTERKVPVLGDIPLLGMLFRFDTQSKDKKEVIIFITPSIVED
jgi:type II secretory pathway component GspD/PulD (secretin)